VARSNTNDYIERHLAICQRIGKPLVMEEFGYPRDGFKFGTHDPTQGRDAYYDFVFRLVTRHAASGGRLAGCNFWGWGGVAAPRHEQWQVGDDYCGDPAQEAQGLNSVFATDSSTLQVVRKYVECLTAVKKSKDTVNRNQ
jgi:mannan endo-1,4-beta-mannosidase